MHASSWLRLTGLSALAVLVACSVSNNDNNQYNNRSVGNPGGTQDAAPPPANSTDAPKNLADTPTCLGCARSRTFFDVTCPECGFTRWDVIVVVGMAAFVFILLMGYFVWCWLNGGQTLPMKTWKLRITNSDGSRLRPTQAILRYMAAWPSILLGGIGLFWAVVDKDKQFLHDRIAGSRIISQASPET